MKHTHQQLIATLALIVGSTTLAAHAAPGAGCIELKTVAEVEQSYTDANGKPATRLVPAAKVVPGNQVTWTVTAQNVCKQAAEKIVVDNPVPEHMTYVADSAFGPGTEITFSIDGREFKKPDALIVKGIDGTTRTARPDEYRYVRWTFANSFAPDSLAFGRYRAAVQ